MSIRVAYVNTDPGIAADGTKGASVHFREFGRSLVRAGCHVQAVGARATNGPFPDFPLRVVASPSSADPMGRELLQLTHQSEVFDTLANTGPHDAVYERYSLFGLAGLTFARQGGLPFFLEVNAPLWEEAARYRGLALADLARSTARALFTEATKVLVVSSGLRNRLLAEGIPANRVELFPNGVAPRFLEDDAKMARPAPFRGRPTIVFVGSLKPWHGIEFLLDGFLRHRAESDACLWVVGDGPLAEAVDWAAREYPHHIVRTPALAHEEVPAVLRAADVTVAPYTADSPDYFCPLKVVEALAVGTPVLTGDVPAVRGLEVDDAHLHWFEPGSLTSFGGALRGVLDDLGAARRSARATNPPIVRSRFTWDGRARDLMRLVQAERAAEPPPTVLAF